MIFTENRSKGPVNLVTFDDALREEMTVIFLQTVSDQSELLVWGYVMSKANLLARYNCANPYMPDNTLESADRRQHSRIHYPMSVKVVGRKREFGTIVTDLSAGGIRTRSMQEISTGERFRFVVAFSIAGRHPKTMPKLSARGIITRVRDLQDGCFEFAARFTRFRFL